MVRLRLKNKLNIDYVIVAGFLSLAFIFRLILMRYHFAIGWDEPHYLQLAIMLSKGQFLQALHPYWSPFYSVCVAAASFIISDFELAGRMVSLMCGILIFIPVFFFTKKLFGKRSGYWAIGLLTFYSPLAFSTTSALAEPTFIFLSIMAIYFGWKAIESKSFKYSIFTGIFFGFSYLTKPEGIGYFFIFIIFSGIYAIIDFIRSQRRMLFIFILSGVSFIFISIPYILYLHHETGRWTISSKVYANQQMEAQSFNNDEINFISLSDDNQVHPFDAIYHEGNFLKLIKENRQQTSSIHVSLLIKKYFTNFYRVTKYAIPQLFGLVMFVLVTVGLCTLPPNLKENRIHLYLLSFVVIFWFVFIPLFHINDRYLLPGLVICFGWIGHGADQLTGRIKRGLDSLIKSNLNRFSRIHTEKISMLVVLTCISLFCLIPELGKILSRDKYSVSFWDDAVELKKAGLWLKNYVSHEPILMSLNKSVDYYAGCCDVRKGTTFSNNSFERVLSYAYHRKVEYMVVAKRYSELFPNLAFLFDDTKIPNTLQLIYEDQEKEGLEVRIFKLNPE